MARPQTVLIVNDNQPLRRMMQLVLAQEGYTTLEAVDGAEAVDRLRRSPGRLVVLLDLRMPKMSGQEVLDLIDDSEAAMSRHAYIVMSAYTLDAAHAALLTRHDIAVMPKLFELDDVLGEVARAVSRLA